MDYLAFHSDAKSIWGIWKLVNCNLNEVSIKGSCGLGKVSVNLCTLV